MPTIAVGIIGDYDPDSPTHRATDEALGHAASHLGLELEIIWLHTSSLAGTGADRLAGFDALWCAPGSPYRCMDGALAAIRVARTTVCPFVGTCGGCQHVVIEYARHVLGVVDDAQHAEYDPYASRLFITPLSCSLAGRTMRVFLIPGSRSHASYGCAVADEQ